MSKSVVVGLGPGATTPEHLQPFAVLASAARIATVSSADLTNGGADGVHVIVDVTAVGAAPSVVFKIEGKDPVSGKYYTLLTSAAVVAVGTTVLKVFPAATPAANTVVNDGLPAIWRVTATHANGDSITYSVAANPLD